MASRLTLSNRAGWGFALPGFGLIAIFIVLPFFFAFYLSLTNQRLISPNPTQWVGLDNYSQLLSVGVLTLEPERDDAGEILRDADGVAEYPRVRNFTRSADYPQYEGMREWFSWQSGENRTVVLASDVVFMTALVNTILFVIVVAPVQATLALGLALLINQRLRGINLFRAIYFMPVVTNIVAVAIVFQWLLNRDFGVANAWVWQLAEATGWRIAPPDWLNSSFWAKPAVVLLTLWKNVGFTMVIYLAGLQAVPQSLYDAAKVDGASGLQRFRYITMPMVSPTTFFLLVIQMIGAFQLFAEPFVMTGGGPAQATLSIVMYIYQNAFEFGRMGKATAIAWILFAIIFVFTLIQTRLQRRWVHYETEG